MSKVVVALPKGGLKRTAVGGVIAFVLYVLCQGVCALLIHKGVMPEGFLYPAVCVSAAVSSLAGCLYTMGRGKSASVLTVLAVAAVFLMLTLAVAVFNADGIAVEQGVVGIGLSMCAGALIAALIGGGSTAGRGGQKRRRAGKGRK